MAPQQCFGVVIRTFGLFLLLSSLYFLFTGIYLVFTPLARLHSLPSTYVVYGIVSGIVCLYFLRGAPGLIGFCYPAPQSSRADQAPT